MGRPWRSGSKLILALMALSPAVPAYADCANPIGVEGQYQYVSPNYKVCDGSVWVSMAAATPSGACSTAGLIDYSGGHRFCNGSLYVSMLGTETGASCTGTAAGAARYNASTKYMESCDATNWRPMRNAASGIAYVQQASVNFTGTAASAQTAAFGGSGNLTAGNLLVCFIVHQQQTNAVTGVTTTGGQSLTRVAAPVIVGGNATAHSAEVWYLENVAATSAAKVTVTVASSAAITLRAICNEYSGIATKNSLDQVAAAGGLTGNTTESIGPVTTTTAKELIFVGAAWDSGTTAVGSGYTKRGSSVATLITEDQIVTTVGARSATATGGSSTSSSGTMVLATFRALN